MSEVEIPQVDRDRRRRCRRRRRRSFTRRRRRSKAVFSTSTWPRFARSSCAAAPARASTRPKRPLPVSKAVKAERVAMEEVKQNLVQWDLPDFKVVVDLR